MIFNSVSNSESKINNCSQPLVDFNQSRRAQVVDFMPRKQQKRSRGKKRGAKRTGARKNLVRVTKGRVRLQLGSKGGKKASFAPASLIPYIPKSVLVKAGKKIKKLDSPIKRRKRVGGNKRRKSRN